MRLSNFWLTLLSSEIHIRVRYDFWFVFLFNFHSATITRVKIDALTLNLEDTKKKCSLRALESRAFQLFANISRIKDGKRKMYKNKVAGNFILYNFATINFLWKFVKSWALELGRIFSFFFQYLEKEASERKFLFNYAALNFIFMHQLLLFNIIVQVRFLRTAVLNFRFLRHSFQRWIKWT